jgi:hypothetical protein
MFGACLFMVGLINLTIKERRLQGIVLGLIVGFAVSFQFRNGEWYSKEWQMQQSLFWQLSWRVPGLKPGTAVLIDKAPMSLSMDYALAVPLNLIYDPNHSSPQLNYWFYDLSRNVGQLVPRVANDVPLNRVLNSLSFFGSTAESVAITFSQPGCLRVIDPTRNDIPRLSELAQAARPLSQVDRIVAVDVSQPHPPNEIFGSEPARGWCYYFEKAESARQMSNWQQVADRGDEARKAGLQPGDNSEWLPFVEAYVRLKRLNDASEIIKAATKDTSVQRPLCNLFDGLKDIRSNDPAYQTFLGEKRSQLLCQN